MTERTYQPLASKQRPQTLDQFVGQDHLVGKDGLVRILLGSGQIKSLIFWGPPGVGKTTLARIIAAEANMEYRELSAVSSGKADIARVVGVAQASQRLGKSSLLFIDEIHRFNKAQQDYLLPFVEDGTLTLVGATTENPSFEVISALLSRAKVLRLHPLSKDQLVDIITRARKQVKGRSIAKSNIDLLAELAAGDARAALNGLETAVSLTKKTITKQHILDAMQTSAQLYDKSGEEHYNTISAYIKSMRGSDVNAALFYLARMMLAGEDPKFIARRLVIFASEDVGMAAPHALTLAVAAFQAVERLGYPEAEYPLTHATIALAKSKKSRSVANALAKSKQLAKDNRQAVVPLHLRNAVTDMMQDFGYQKDYKWQADFKHPNGFLPHDLNGSTDLYRS